jgi:RimJ/RimL family protein N-acetyltransferase
MTVKGVTPRQDEDQSRGLPEEASLHNIHFRLIRPDDWHRLQLFHQRLSASSVHLRFHGAKRELSAPLAHRFTELDGHNNGAVVATTGTRGRIVGVARFFRISPTAAEVAFVVEDEYQGRGIGRRLMDLLVAEGRKNGFTEFVAEVLQENVRMLRLLEHTGPVRLCYQQGVDEVRLSI